MSRKTLGFASLALTGALASGLWLAPSAASACGGFFCDGGPQPMPVDQTGENIIYVVDRNEVEVHIQIQYEGDPERFAWVIPVLVQPAEIAVGSEQFFVNTLNGTVPSYGQTFQRDDCTMPNDGSDPGGFGSAGGGDGDGTGGGDEGGSGEPPPDPTVFSTATVGAFDVTILGDGTPEGIMKWLGDNGYQQDEAATPIIAEYHGENHFFAAVKLTGGAGIEEIHPLVFRFENSEPCIPLRLTRIAAADDMPVRAFFFGDARVAPKTYRHVLVNPLKIDWINQAPNYTDVIDKAVDAEHADGRAFVTEYAGASDVVGSNGLFSDAWVPGDFTVDDPVQAIARIKAQGLFACDFDFGQGCGGLHPMMDAILAELLPPPAGVNADDFYDDPTPYVDQIDMDLWDPMLFSERIAERIVEPGRRAVDILAHNPYATRLYTRISPHEMTADPMFHENADLPDVDRVRTATRRTLCNGDDVWILPDGREVYIPQGEAWPPFEGEMPWEAEVADVPPEGAMLMLTDNHPLIDKLLVAHNETKGWRGGGRSDGPDEGGGSGCGCRTTNPMQGVLWMLLCGVGVVALRRRPT